MFMLTEQICSLLTLGGFVRSVPLGCVSMLAPQATSAMQPGRDGPGSVPGEGGSGLGTGCTSTTTTGRDD